MTSKAWNIMTQSRSGSVGLAGSAWSKWPKVGLLGLVGTLLLTSCATRQKTTEAAAEPRMADPVVTAFPITPSEPPRVARISQDPLPVYQPARVREVKMDAYINERGEAFPPSVKYVIDDPGGWNMDALRNPQQAYVPPSSALEVPTAPGTKYTGLYQSSAAPAGPEGGKFLYDLKDVRITGFTDMSQESRARGMAKPNEAVIFDENLGWVLVPKDVIRGSSSGSKARAPIPRSTPVPQTELRSSPTPAPAPAASDFDLIQGAPQGSPPSSSELGVPSGELD